MILSWEGAEVYSSRKIIVINFHRKHMFFKLQILGQKML